MGWLLLSVSEAAAGPSPRPSVPWHFQHSSLVKSSFPCCMLSKLTAGSGGTWIGAPGFSLFHLGEKVLMNATRSTRCWSVRAYHAGIFELTNPRAMAFERSSSVGRVPVGVERHLKDAKFRGWM